MKQYGVLVVDDSSFMRRCISLIIEKDPQFFIIGIARNGIEAIEKIKRLKPDIVTMDFEMPEMDGIEALEEIMNTCPVPIFMLSNYTEKGANTTIKALELGAVDFFLKSELIKEDVSKDVVDDFLNRLKIIAQEGKVPIKDSEKSIENYLGNDCLVKERKVDLIIIGCSTGGPSALQAILPRFPKDTCVPIVVLQHMPSGFTAPLAERFNTICSLNIKEAKDEDILESGNVYIAPAGFQTYIHERKDGCISLKIKDYANLETVYKPSINVTLNSAAPIYKNRLLSVILTGMGNDGLIGCETVKKFSGNVIVEAEESCIVYGMPKVVFEAGLADAQEALPQIYQEIVKYI